MPHVTHGAADVAVDKDIGRAFGGVFCELKAEEEDFLLKTAERPRYGPGIAIVRENRQSSGIYVIVSGRARVEFNRAGDDGTPMAVEVARLGRGDIIGEMSFVDGERTSASVIAETPVDILYIDEMMIQTLLKGDPTFGIRFYKSLAVTMAKRIRATNERTALVLRNAAIQGDPQRREAE